MKRIKVMPIFGTRPEAIKMAPVIKKLQQHQELEVVVTVTAQHREMLDQVMALFKIQPDYDLDIMKKDQSLKDILARVMEGIKVILHKEKPDMVLVHGDTSTAFAASLAAFYEKTGIGHIEAGLRSFNKYAPFPEEMNRKLIDCLSDIYFAPTASSMRNLLREGISRDRIIITGNTVIDALYEMLRENYPFKEERLKGIDFVHRKVILLTAHRRENIGEPMRNIFQAVKEILQKHPDVEMVFPIHRNPQIRQLVHEILGGVERVHLIEPLDYQDFANLMQKCYLVLTDSGGIQEEAPALGKPVLLLRDTTERPDAVEAGTVILVGAEKDRITQETGRLIREREAYLAMSNRINPYGDGRASQRIVQAILYAHGRSSVPADEFLG
ncbi:MAG: non-hydrolyzing UDP-N-acetylglucosamine 2-epimerase [Clostridia bacterium]|jgi:UDP-N-acetylglucosamine 2-epimerase (non-hydrolysing)